MTVGTGNPGEEHADYCPVHSSQLRTLVFHRMSDRASIAQQFSSMAEDLNKNVCVSGT